MDRLLTPPVHQRGFSLLEALVTLAITAFGILGLLRIDMLAQQNRLDSLQIHRANVFAQNLIEQSLASATLAGTLPATSDAAASAGNGLVYWASTNGSQVTEVLVQWTSPVTNASSTLCFVGAVSDTTSYCAGKSVF